MATQDSLPVLRVVFIKEDTLYQKKIWIDNKKMPKKYANVTMLL